MKLLMSVSLWFYKKMVQELQELKNILGAICVKAEKKK